MIVNVFNVQVFSCSWREEEEEPPQNCYYKRNCVELDGMYVCRQGHCSRRVQAFRQGHCSR